MVALNHILDGSLHTLSEEQFAFVADLAKKYPFSSYVQLVYAKALHGYDAVAFGEALGGLAIQVNSRAVLYDLIHGAPKPLDDEFVELGVDGGEAVELDGALEVLEKEMQREVLANSYRLETEHPIESGLEEGIFENKKFEQSLMPEKTIQGNKTGSNSKKTFLDWLEILDDAETDSFVTYAHDKYQKSFYSAEVMAKKSEVDQADLVSETLANIYFTQGKYEKALEYYQKLCLLFPEKSELFAVKISEIKKLNI